MTYHDPLAPEPANPYKWVDGMKIDRPMWPPAAEITAQAFDKFGEWCKQVDPDGERDLYDLAMEYPSATPRSPDRPTAQQAQAQPVEEPIPGPTDPAKPSDLGSARRNAQLVRRRTPSLLDEQHMRAWEQKRRW